MERAAETKSYHGRERRRHKVYVTRNTEYHTRDRICVRVRDRRSGTWIEGHDALGHRLTGAIHQPVFAGDSPVRSEPTLGDVLLFESGPHQVVTSTLVRIDRPPREIAQQYPRLVH